METVTQDSPNGVHHDDPDDSRSREEFVIAANGQMTFAVGGKKPTAASIRMVGGRVDMAGEHEKGTLLKITGFVRVTGVEFVDTLDRETKQVVGCEKRHKVTWDAPPLLESVGKA